MAGNTAHAHQVAKPIFYDPRRADAAISAVLDLSVMFNALTRTDEGSPEELAGLFVTLRPRMRELINIAQSAVMDEMETGESLLRRFDAGWSGALLPAQAVLYEHHDGRRKVAASAESALFTTGEPGWNRAGHVDVSELGRA